MKITLLTSNDSRHNYFINLLSEISDELFVIQECGTIFQGVVPGHYPKSETMEKYFTQVRKAQNLFFGNSYVNNKLRNIKIFPMLMGDLTKCNLNLLSDFLKSDIYIVFGSSYIKGDLVNFLVSKRAINIHMGVSPYYRGCDCNFWALNDKNPHLVGSTIHLLSKGLDNGPMLYHAMSKIKTDPFEYTMSTVKSALHSIVERIKNKTLFKFQILEQDKSKEIRYSKSIDFSEEVIKNYFSSKIDLSIKNFDNSLLKDPFYLEK